MPEGKVIEGGKIRMQREDGAYEKYQIDGDWRKYQGWKGKRVSFTTKTASGGDAKQEKQIVAVNVELLE